MPGYTENPTVVLQQYFTDIYENSMKSLSLSHPDLRVQAVGFQEWEGQWIGVMVTPWFLNLMVLPKDAEQWPDLHEGKGNELFLEFPYGVLRFEPRVDPDLGVHLVCSLASPMDHFDSHQQVVAVAEEILQSLSRIPMTEIPLDAPEIPERRAVFTSAMSSTANQPQVAAILQPTCSKA